MFGNPTRKKEEARDVDVLAWLDSLFRDVRYALPPPSRQAHAFTLVAVLSLALGIGANTAIFSLTDALVLKSLPVQHPEQLLEVNMGETNNDYLTNPLWEQIRDNVTVFSGVFAYSDAQFNLAPGGEVRMANGGWVSGAFFNVLGVRPEAGRLLERSDDVPGCPATVAVSDAFARREFGDPVSAPGKTITLADHPVAVVGVADPAFFGIQVGRTADVYVPLCLQSLLIRPGILDVRAAPGFSTSSGGRNRVSHRNKCTLRSSSPRRPSTERRFPQTGERASRRSTCSARSMWRPPPRGSPICVGTIAAHSTFSWSWLALCC